MKMKFPTKSGLLFFLLTSLAAANGAQATSMSQITATITFTLTDIQVGGMSATEFFDYEPDGLVEADSFFNEQFLFGGTGSTTGSSSSSLNGSTIDPNFGDGPLQVGDMFSLTLNSQATANTGFVNRNQFESVYFDFLNWTDDGFGDPLTLSFLFDYAVTYTTSLSNDIAGDQAFVFFRTTVELSDNSGTTTIDLFPQSTVDELFELSFAAGTVTPGGMRSGSFSFDLSDSSGSFAFEAQAGTPTNINAVPLPAAVWLFGSGLVGLISITRRKAV